MSANGLEMGLTLTMIGDWHVGQGAGIPGSIDRLVVRHREDDLPFVPGKTLRGLWRDACETIAQGLDAPATGGGPNWQQWVNLIFGDQPAQPTHPRNGGVFDEPRPGRLCVPPARYPARVRDVLAADRCLARELTFLKPGVSIDPATGQAKDDMLRFEEVVRGIDTLAMACEPNASLDLAGLGAREREAACALLWAGGLAIERLGGKRRRGMGRCALRVKFGADDLKKRATADWLKTLGAPPPALPPRQGRPNPTALGGYMLTSAQRTGPVTWREWELTLTLVTPVMVVRQVVGNVVESLDYVPGGMLLGPVSRAIATALRRPSLLPEIAAGRLIVTHAYVQVGGRRGLPTPMSLFYDKDRGGLPDPDGTVYNRFHDPEPADAATQLKQHRGGYVGIFDGKALPPFVRHDGLTEPFTHNTVEDDPQRPTSAVGGVYTYQAIVGGTELRARLLLDDSLARKIPADWHTHLPKLVQLGAAKKDDYGLAELAAGPAHADPVAAAASGELSVWLTSDLLMRGDCLSLSNQTERLRILLENRLNNDSNTGGANNAPQPKITLAAGADPAAFVRTHRTEGWVAAWQLPRPSYVGLAAGSCVHFRMGNVPPDLTDRLARIQQSALGERRAEGFGQVLLNPALLTTPLLGLGSSAATGQRNDPAPSAGGQTSAPGDLRELEKLAWQRIIRRQAALLAENETMRRDLFHWTGVDRPEPSNSQLGALRGQIMRVRNSVDAQGFQRWVTSVREHDGERDPAHKKWPERSLPTIGTLFTDPNRVWELLRSVEPEAGRPVAPPGSLKDVLRYEAVRALVLFAIRAEVRRREQFERSRTRPQPRAAAGQAGQTKAGG